MKKRKTLKSRALVWILNFAMLVGLIQGNLLLNTVQAVGTGSTYEASGAHIHNGITFASWPESGSPIALSSGNYVLTKDVTLTASVTISGTVNLCLNGHTMTVNANTNLFYVNPGSTFSIYDCTGNGKLTGGKGYYDTSKKNYKGGAIYLKQATLNLYGGSIEGNSAEWGGAIFVDATSSNSTVNMYGGSIQNNNATKGGGGIELENDSSTLNMYGGSIVNNTVSNKDGGYHKGGGIHHLGILNIYGTAGDVQISGNTVAGVENNIYLRTGRVISVQGMTPSSRIGVSAYDVEKKATSTKIATINNTLSINASNIFLDGTHNSTTYALAQVGTELRIVSHSHSWEYGVDGTGEKILAYCTNNTPNCSYYGTAESHDNALKLTLTASNAVYSGSPYQGANVVDDISPVVGGTSVTKDSIQYYKRGEGTALGSAPTNAGKYTAKVTLGGKTAAVDFEISSLKVAKPEANTSTFTYTGEEQTYTLTENERYTVKNNKRTASGSQTVTVALKDKTNTAWEGGSTDDLTFKFTIQKASQSATVAMADYSLIGTVSTPTISGQKENPTVTYYYNTTNSNENGTKWENISVDTLAPGIYYMYATLSETENYNAYTTPTTSFRVGRLPTSIQNGSFETPAIGSWYSIMPETTPSIAWQTTASDHKIEFARPSKNMSAANSAYHTTTTVDGYQFAELCANQVGALYQTVSTFSDDTLKWGFSHKGRSGNDTMELWIGSPADVTAVLNYYKSHNNSVAGIAEDAELLAKYQTISQNSDGTKRSYTDGNTQWVSYTGDYVVPENQTETTFAFVSIAASGNRISYGNLLDNVYFTTQVPVKTQLFQYDATSGGSVTASVDDIPVDGKETFVSEGSTIKFSQSANTGYTYNGGFVNGSYISMDRLPLSYTVSENDTDLKHITLLFSKDSTIVFDKEGGTYADDAYDLKVNTDYTLKANPKKDGYSFDKWIIAGSDVTLTEGNYIIYETGSDAKTYIRVYDNSSKGRKLYECESELGINLIATYDFTSFPSAKVELHMEGGELGGGREPLTYKLNEFDLKENAASGDLIEYSAMTLPTPSKGVYVFKGWKLGDKIYDAGTEIKYALSASNQNGTVTIGTDTQSAITTDTTYTLKAQWETIPMQGVTATGVSKVYDGTPSAAITVSGTPAGATVSYGTTEGTYNLSVCPTYKNTGVYTVYYKVSADGYTNHTGSAKITIKQRPVTLNWSSTELTYTGSEQEVTAEVSNKASDTDSFTITYNNNKKTAAGEYTATVTGLGNDNYTLTGATGVTQNWGISYLDADATVSGTLGNNDWYISDVTLTPATTGYKISANGTNWQDSLVISTEGENTVTYYLKQESTNYLTEQKSKVIKIDKTAPSGTVSISTNSWIDFWNRVTFGCFFKETQEVTVTAQDTTGGSGIDKVYYYKAATPISNANDLADVSWKSASNNKFNIEKNEKRYVYVKIEDKAGNKHYISTDGIVVYSDAAQVTTEITYTKKSLQNADAVVALNGNTIKEVRNGDSVLTKGTDYEISSDGATITFAATYLQGLDANDYIINVSYNPGGETYVEKAGNVPPVDTTIKLSVINAVGSVTGISDISKEYDGTGVNAPTFTTTNDRGTNGSNVTIEYRKADEDTYTTEKPKDAGSYVVRITVEADSNYKKVSAEKEFTISPKKVNATVSVADRAYNGTKTAEVTATVDTGIAGQTLTITGLTGTFDNENAGTDKTVTINSTNAVVTRGTGTNAGNYKVTYPATTTANIRAVALTVKVKDVEKHIGYEDPAFTYTITSGSLVDGETLSGISYSRDAGETAGEYNITATETSGSNSNYVLTLQTGKLTIVDHTVVTDSAAAPTCTTTGLTEGSHCSVCSKVITAQTTVPALGHDWSGEWTVINQPTDTEEGKKEKTCSREGCGVKKYEVLPKNGSTDDLPANVSGTLEKNAEVAPDSPIQEATLDNKKSELLNAPNIFTDGEKQQIAGGADAKVWLEVTKTDESNIPTVDKTKVENEAKNIMGDHPTITYFDVDLFKQIAGEAKQRLHEPGINIKVTILIPSDLLNHDKTIVREYKIIRLHDNDVSVLSGEFDEASKEFTFETDKFSTYAIAYSDIQLVTGITLTPDSATLTNKGETVQLTATVTPENAADKSVTWASSNTNVATVDANGKVTAVANGTCTITVTTTDGEKTATSTITVTIPSDDTGNTGDAGNTNDKKNNKPEAPKTGDDSNPALWFGLLFMSLAGLAVFFARKKKDCK